MKKAQLPPQYRKLNISFLLVFWVSKNILEFPQSRLFLSLLKLALWHIGGEPGDPFLAPPLLCHL